MHRSCQVFPGWFVLVIIGCLCTLSPTSALDSLILSQSPMVKLEYEVLTPENTPGLPVEAIAAGGVLNVTFTYAGEGYVALGISPSLKMTNSENIIAAYPSPPEKFTIATYNPSSIARMPEKQQTLLDATVTQENGQTTMTFKKLLVEEGEYPLTVGAETNFIWAVGATNYRSFHRARDVFTTTLTAQGAPPTPPTPPLVPAPTASPPAGGLDALTLHKDPMVLLEYEVLTPENRPGLLSEEAVAAGGVWNVTLTYAGKGYVALGISPTLKMLNSENIIGMYPGVPEKYSIVGYDGAGITRMPEAQQTLLDASITQENGMTIMRFSKLLVEEGELPLTVGAENNFVWAIGNGNSLSYHSVRSSFTASLQPGEPIALGSSEVLYKSFWKAHGTVAVLGWGLFAPLAIASSLCRALILGPGVWLKLHIYLNMLCMIFTVLLFFLGVAATEKTGADHFNGTHQKIGLAIIVMSLFQVVGGYMRPHPPGHQHVEEDEEEDTEPDVEKDGEVDVDAATERVEEEKKEKPHEDTPKKSTARAAFEIYHRIIACLLLVLALYNIDDGLKLYAMRYGNDEDYRTVYWVMVAILFGAVLATTTYAKFLL